MSISNTGIMLLLPIKLLIYNKNDTYQLHKRVRNIIFLNTVIQKCATATY